MADERVVAELVAQGASKFIQDFANSANAVAALQTTLESTNRISTSQLNASIVDIARSIDQLSKDGVKDLDDVIKKFGELLNAVNNAGQRIRTPQLRDLTQGLQGALGEVGAARNRASLPNVQRTLDPSIQLQQAQIQALAAAQLGAQRAAAAHAATLQGRLQGALNAVTTATKNVVATQVQHIQTMRGVTTASQQTAQAVNQNAGALVNQSSVQRTASAQGITYLSTLSAIHAASFLATGQTFTLVGSFFTLIAAFSKLGPAGFATGVTLSALFGIFGALNNAIQIIQQALITFATVLVKVSTAASVAIAAAAGASVKIAADVEESLGLIQAIEQPTRAALGALEEQITQLALKFGLSAKDVTDAASLYVRAGGDIESALNGALAAIIHLQIASAGELQAATAARTVAVGLKAFSKEGVTATDVANAITRAAQGSALSFTELNQAFQQAVPGAVTLGIPLNELAGIIAVLGNNALRGTVAGTSFKQFLLDLVNPSSQAAKNLNDLGISVQDADGKFRPLRDIMEDLTRKLKDYEQSATVGADATKAQAIAAIFGSRAGLAANVIIRDSVAALDEFNEKTRETTAANVAATLLLPLNAQFRILQNNLRETGRAFGAPLLAPIAAATTAAGKFILDLIPIAKLAGQALAVIITGQGFGALKEQLEKVADTRAVVFFIELINVGRNVADVINNQIVPAIRDFVATLTGVANEDGRLEQTVKGFNTINKAIQVAGVVAATAIRNFGLLVAEFINGTGEGGKLRDILDTIATKVLVTFISNIITLAASLGGALLVLDKFVDLSIAAARAVLAVVDSVFELNFKLTQLSSRGEIMRKIVDEKDEKKLEALKLELAKLDAQIANTPDSARRDQTVTNIIKSIDDFQTGRARIRSQMDRLGQDIQASNTKILTSFQNIAGELPDILSNITAAIDKAQADQEAAGRSGTRGAVGALVDPKEIARVIKQIEEAGRDLSRKLDNLAADTTSKIGNIVEKALEKIGDINDKLRVSLAKLERDTKEKIDDLNTNVTQRRDDRTRLDIEKRQQERRLQVIERSLEKQAIFEERQLEDVRILRQRGLEDVQRVYDLQADAAELSYSRQQAAAEVAFQAQQKAQERALELTQSAEEKALQRQLDIESRTRSETQQRSEAKTPDERKRVEEQIARARSDKAFETKQQGQLDTLKLRHENQRLALTQKQEQQARAFQIGQENAALAEQLKRDARALTFRRGLENEERRVRLQEEDVALVKRQSNEDFLDAYKRTQAQLFQNFQDKLEDEATQRQIERIKRENLERKTDLTDEAGRQRGEVVDQVTQQLAEINQVIDREVRNALDRLTDIEDGLTPDVAAAVRGSLLAVQQAAVSRSLELVNSVKTQTNAAQTQVQMEVTQPFQVGGMVAATLTVQNLVLPGGFEAGIARGTYAALQQADIQGFFDTDIPALRELINVLQNPSPLSPRR